MSLGKQSCCNKQLLLLRSSSLQQRQVPLMSVRLPWVVEKWEGGGGGGMHSPTGLLAEKFLRCVSAPGCAPQPTLVGAQLLSMISKTHVLAAPWAPATVGGGVSPYSFPFPHAHVSGWGSLATVSPLRIPIYCGTQGSVGATKMFSILMQAVSREDASRWCSSPRCLTQGCEGLLLEVTLFWGSPCFLCPLV